MRALFIGGVVDNSEMDLDGNQPPVHYPENSGSGRPATGCIKSASAATAASLMRSMARPIWPTRKWNASPTNAATPGASKPSPPSRRIDRSRHITLRAETMEMRDFQA